MIGLVPQELHTDAFETVWATVTFSRGLFGKPRAAPTRKQAIAKHTDRDGERGNAALFIVAAMALVMPVVAFTLHRNSPFVAAAASSTSEPIKSGQGGLVPARRWRRGAASRS
jgi:hypothetical protein